VRRVAWPRAVGRFNFSLPLLDRLRRWGFLDKARERRETESYFDRLARAGLGILLISSELPEVLNLSDRILVMREGRPAGELRREEADQASLLRLMAGVVV